MTDHGQLLYGDSIGAFVNRYGAAAEDPPHETVDFIWRSKYFDMGLLHDYKLFRFVFLYLIKGYSNDIKFSFYMDHDKDSWSEDIDLRDLGGTLRADYGGDAE